MLTLAFDTSAASIAIALVLDGKVLHKKINPESGMQSQLLVVEIEEALRKGNIWYQDLDLVVSTKGPGSFTGTRIGLTVSRVIKASTNLPLILMNSDEVKNFEIDQIAFLGIEKFVNGEITSDLSPIYAQGPRITERKK
jgi:tRNA threonylcarbamoyladenosine biosynthesis protein TsaB